MRLEHWFYTMPLRLRSLFRRRQVEAELDEELQYHLERKIEEYIAQGLGPKEARYAAFRAMDGLEQRKEECRDKRRMNSIENFFQDLRYGLRMLRKNPGFTAVAVLTLALGIGANTAIFTVVNAVLLRPLAYPEPDRIVNFMLGDHEIEGTSVPMFMFWREQTEVLEDFALYGEVVKGPGVNLTNTDRPQRLRSIPVSADFFKLFGASIEIGRTFTAQEDVPGGPRLAVLSDGFWRRRFSADRSMVGKSILLGGEPYVVIGIVRDIEPIHSGWNTQGPSLRTDTPADVWLAVQADPNSTDQGGNYRAAARLKPGVTLEMAKARTKLAEARFRQKFPGGKLSSFSFNLELLSEAMVGNVRLALLVLMGAVGLVLLIACANVANLLLARATGRRREMAIRAALGAGRRRIVFQLLTETLPLSLAGGALGVGFGYSVLRALLAGSSVNIPRIGAQGSAVTLDSRVIIFTMLTATFTAILFGLIPALSASHDDVNAALKESGARSGGGLGQNKTRSILVVVEMALTLVLLAGAALLMRTFVALRTVDPGFEVHKVLTFEMSLNQPRFDQTMAVARLLRDAQRRVEGIPGVEALAATRSLPLDPNPDYAPVTIEGRPPTKDRYQDWASGHFRCIDLGRAFLLSFVRNNITSGSASITSYSAELSGYTDRPTFASVFVDQSQRPQGSPVGAGVQEVFETEEDLVAEPRFEPTYKFNLLERQPWAWLRNSKTGARDPVCTDRATEFSLPVAACYIILGRGGAVAPAPWRLTGGWIDVFTKVALAKISAVSHGNPSGVAEDAVVRSMPSVQCGVARTSGRLPNPQEVPELL
jgi:hypothetical protein